jgi:hypothetical protein
LGIFCRPAKRPAKLFSKTFYIFYFFIFSLYKKFLKKFAYLHKIGKKALFIWVLAPAKLYAKLKKFCRFAGQNVNFRQIFQFLHFVLYYRIFAQKFFKSFAGRFAGHF